MMNRLKVVPGSDEDTKYYLQAKGIDELFSLLDTIDTQAKTAEHNRKFKSLNNY